MESGVEGIPPASAVARAPVRSLVSGGQRIDPYRRRTIRFEPTGHSNEVDSYDAIKPPPTYSAYYSQPQQLLKHFFVALRRETIALSKGKNPLE